MFTLNSFVLLGKNLVSDTKANEEPDPMINSSDEKYIAPISYESDELISNDELMNIFKLFCVGLLSNPRPT